VSDDYITVQEEPPAAKNSGLAREETAAEATAPEVLTPSKNASPIEANPMTTEEETTVEREFAVEATNTVEDTTAVNDSSSVDTNAVEGALKSGQSSENGGILTGEMTSAERVLLPVDTVGNSSIMENIILGEQGYNGGRIAKGGDMAMIEERPEIGGGPEGEEVLSVEELPVEEGANTGKETCMPMQK